MPLGFGLIVSCYCWLQWFSFSKMFIGVACCPCSGDSSNVASVVVFFKVGYFHGAASCPCSGDSSDLVSVLVLLQVRYFHGAISCPCSGDSSDLASAKLFFSISILK